PKLPPVFHDWVVELEADGKKYQWKGNRLQASFSWPAAKGVEPSSALRIGQAIPNAFYSHAGLWGIFRVMDYAEDRPPEPKVIQWKYRGQAGQEPIQPAPVEMELLDLPAGIDVFNREFLGTFRAPPKAVQ